MRGNGSDRTSRDDELGKQKAARPVLGCCLAFAVVRLTVTTRICNGVSADAGTELVCGRTDQTRYTAGELWVMMGQVAKGQKEWR